MPRDRGGEVPPASTPALGRGQWQRQAEERREVGRERKSETWLGIPAKAPGPQAPQPPGQSSAGPGPAPTPVSGGGKGPEGAQQDVVAESRAQVGPPAEPAEGPQPGPSSAAAAPVEETPSRSAESSERVQEGETRSGNWEPVPIPQQDAQDLAEPQNSRLRVAVNWHPLEGPEDVRERTRSSDIYLARCLEAGSDPAPWYQVVVPPEAFREGLQVPRFWAILPAGHFFSLGSPGEGGAEPPGPILPSVHAGRSGAAG